MMGDYQRFERWGDEMDDEEYPDENDLDDEISETLPCPECGTEVYEDSVQCPACGAYITPGTRTVPGRPAWWLVLGLAAALLAILALALVPPW